MDGWMDGKPGPCDTSFVPSDLQVRLSQGPLSASGPGVMMQACNPCTPVGREWKMVVTFEASVGYTVSRRLKIKLIACR